MQTGRSSKKEVCTTQMIALIASHVVEQSAAAGCCSRRVLDTRHRKLLGRQQSTIDYLTVGLSADVAARIMAEEYRCRRAVGGHPMEEVRLSRRCRPSMQVGETRLAFHGFDMSACFFGTCRMAFGAGAVRPDISINVNLLLGKSAGDAQYPEWHRYTMVCIWCTYGIRAVVQREPKGTICVGCQHGGRFGELPRPLPDHLSHHRQGSRLADVAEQERKVYLRKHNKVTTPMAVTRGSIEH